MNKHFKIACLVLVLITIMGNRFSANSQNTKVRTNHQVLNYVWFTDEELTNPTGTAWDINVELTRLRAIHPSYVFSASPGMSLHQYEFGYYPFYPLLIIYSDLP